MWSAFQALHLATKKSVKNNYFEGGGSHSWISYYQERIKSKSFYLHEWHTITDASETTNNLYEYTNKYVAMFNYFFVFHITIYLFSISDLLSSWTLKSGLRRNLRR